MLLARFLASSSDAGYLWPVVAIVEGPGLNRLGPHGPHERFVAENLRESLGLFDRLPVNAYELLDASGSVLHDHQQSEDFVGRAPLNQVGWLENPRWQESVDGDRGGVVADLRLIRGDEVAEKIREKLMAIEESGGLDTLGLSIEGHAEVYDDGTILLRSLSSVDIVTHPAAGGRIGHRIAASRRAGPAPSNPTRRTESMNPLVQALMRLHPKFPERICEGLSKGDSLKVVARHIAKRVAENEAEAAEVIGALGWDAAMLANADPAEVVALLEKLLAFVKSTMPGGDAGGDTPPVPAPVAAARVTAGADAIASAINDSGMSLDEVAAKLPVDAATLGAIAAGEVTPEDDVLRAIANVLGLSFDALKGSDSGGGDDGGDAGDAATVQEGIMSGKITEYERRAKEAAERAEAREKEAAIRQSRAWLKDACAERRLTEAATTRLIEQHEGATFASFEAADAIAKKEQEYLDDHISTTEPARLRVVRESADNAIDVLAHMLNPRRIEVPKCGIDGIGHSLHRFHEKFFGIDLRDLKGGHTAQRRIRQAVNSTNYDQVYADATNRALLAEYNGQDRLQDWRNIVNIVPYNDFRTNHVIVTGYYGNLPDVAEGAPYNALTTPTDREETIALGKKGGTETISMESMLNDDLGLWQSTIRRLGRAAAETIHNAVFAVIRDATQPTMSDSNTLTSSSRSPVNEATDPLTADAAGKTAVIDAITNMMQGTGGSGQVKNIVPRYLVVPFAKLEAAAFVINELKGGNTGTELPQALRVLQVGLPEVIIDWGTGNNTDWYLVADPGDAEVIRVGFLGGNQDPEIFLDDQEGFGGMFLRDTITLKIRHIYAVGAVDFLGIYGNDAAS